MRFIVDTQLPFGLKRILNDAGFDTIHTDDLPDQERTTDKQIRELSVFKDRIIISKDSDLVDSHYIHGIPKKLFLISTGNIQNKDFFESFKRNIIQIVKLLEFCNLIEMDNFEIICHE